MPRNRTTPPTLTRSPPAVPNTSRTIQINICMALIKTMPYHAPIHCLVCVLQWSRFRTYRARCPLNATRRAGQQRQRRQQRLITWGRVLAGRQCANRLRSVLSVKEHNGPPWNLVECPPEHCQDALFQAPSLGVASTTRSAYGRAGALALPSNLLPSFHADVDSKSHCVLVNILQ